MPTMSYEDISGEESWAAYFEALMHSRFFHPSIASGDIASEMHLQFAVMEETVRCVSRYRLAPSAAGWREMTEAMAWVNLPGNHDRFSFDTICQVFEIDSALLRQRLNSLGRRLRSGSPFFRR
jgi:hypothetical protein